MIKKLSFAIENAEMIQENPDSNFALLALDFFASGDNLHDMYVSEDTLLRTADTIKNCPLVWKYDEILDDVYTHDPDEVPCGFVPESATITAKKLPDGRTMLSSIAYVWKRYTGELLSFFKRDGGNKPVSVEMSVYKTQPKDNGKTELLDFRYEGITVLGSYVTPAIPMAKASVLSFAEEYEEDLEKEFSFSEIIIPNKIRKNAEKGLEIRKEEGGGTSTGVAFARYLIKNKITTPEKVREIANYFSTHKYSNETVDWLLWGGDYAEEWARKISEKIDKELVTFPYKSIKDINPALKGIEPPISLGQANAIANQADSIGSDKEKNGWAIAISSFRKTHHVEEGKWVKNEGSTVKASADETDEEIINKEMAMDKTKEEMAAEEAKKTEMAAEEEKKAEIPAEKEKKAEMASDTAKSEEKETPEEEKKETPAEEKEEIKKGIEKKFEFPIEKCGEMFSEDDDEDDVKMAKAEIAKGKEADFGVVMQGMYAKMCKMASAIEKMAADTKVYMAENEELKKFKAEYEASQKQFAIDQTLKELELAVVIPAEVKKEMIEESAKYSFENIDAWKNYCKAKSFDFAIIKDSKLDVEKIGMPFSGITKQKDDLWGQK